MNCNFCSSVPNSNRVGTNISIPCPPIAEGMFDFENSVANILLLIISASPPKPPYFLGTDLAKYPLLIKIDCHSDRVTVFSLFLDASSKGIMPLSIKLTPFHLLQNSWTSFLKLSYS